MILDLDSQKIYLNLKER